MDVQQSGTISCAMIDAGKNKDLKIERKVVDEADAEEEARRLRELVDAVRHHAAVQGESGKLAKEDSDWTSKVEQLLGSYDFFKPLEALQPGLVGRLSKEVIYEEVPADVVIFRQQDEPDGCWVVISGCVGVHLWRNSELMDEEVPTPRDAFDPSSFELKGAPKHQRRKGKLRSTRTFAALPTHLVEEEETKAESATPAGSPSGGNKRMLLPRSQTSESMDGKDGKGKDKDVPRYRSFEGFSTYTEKSILGVQVAQLGSGRIFGELALQNTKPRAATIKCEEDSAFLRIPYATYQGVVKEIFEEARAVEESIRILKTSAFFRDLERNSPGLIKELASRGCTKIEERCEQVLFRQLDPPNNCYILLEGSVDVFIYKKTKDKSVSLLRKDDQPTPRHQEPIDKKTTITEAAKLWKQQKEAEKANKLRPVNKKDKNRKFDPWPGEFTRYKTTEGFSTFAKDSKYGKLVTTLKPGAVVGELGLRNNEPRAATIRCAENCKFLVVGKNIFLEVLKECLEMMRFFNLHLPGLFKLEYTNGVHPCVYFQERVFPPDFDFMIEGIVAAEPAAYLIREGTVRFQRHKYAGENWVYAHRHAPLTRSRLPDLPVYHQYSTSSIRNRRILELQGHGHASLVCNFRTQSLAESGGESPKFSKLGNDPARPQTGAPKETRLVTCDVIKEPNLFCSMPFLPLPAAEPFSVKATTPVNAFHLGGPSVEKMPVQLLKAMREVLFRELSSRTKASDVDPFPMPPDLRPATSALSEVAESVSVKT